MKKIIYRNPNDAENFDIKRFVKSLNKYAKISEKETKEALAEFDQYETMHASCLVEVGMKLIGEKAGDEAMKEYYDAHAEYFDEGKFERLRRITGYLVGSLERWNDGKKAEEAARVKHDVCLCDKDGVYSKAEKAAREKAKRTSRKALGKA